MLSFPSTLLLRLQDHTLQGGALRGSGAEAVDPAGLAHPQLGAAPIVETGAMSEPASQSIWEVLTWPDQLGLVLIGTFLVLGAVRGLWWQVIRLAGLLFAGILARALAPSFSEGLAHATGLPLVVSQGLLWFTIFVLGLVVASLLGTIGKKSLELMQLGLVDRFGGALAGLLTGVALQAALLVLLSYLGPQPWTQDTLRGTRSEGLLRLVSGRLPLFVDRRSIAAREIRSWIGSDGVVHAESPADPPTDELPSGDPTGEFELPTDQGLSEPLPPERESAPRVR